MFRHKYELIITQISEVTDIGYETIIYIYTVSEYRKTRILSFLLIKT